MSSKSSRTRVPVVHRRSDVQRGASKSKRLIRPPANFGALELIVIVGLLILFLLTIALPLRNYFEQRNEIKATSAAIAQKEQRKQQLLSELDKYRSDAYVQEQARNRLGVIAPGEVAFRIIDPQMLKEDSVTSKSGHAAEQERPWFDTLWGSISTPAEEAVTGEKPEPAPSMHMPIAPVPGENQPPAEDPEGPAQPAAPAQ